jgi:GTP1/Obg family GTP-binding protein
VVFVTDLSGLSGTSISDQLELRESLFEQFAHRRPWIDVFSKAATVPVLGGTTDPEAQELWNERDVEEANAAIAAIPDAMPTSAFEGWGIPELQERLTSLLRKHKEQSLESTDFAESNKAEGEVL